jgi:hypothetical protein
MGELQLVPSRARVVPGAQVIMSSDTRTSSVGLAKDPPLSAYGEVRCWSLQNDSPPMLVAERISSRLKLRSSLHILQICLRTNDQPRSSRPQGRETNIFTDRGFPFSFPHSPDCAPNPRRALAPALHQAWSIGVVLAGGARDRSAPTDSACRRSRPVLRVPAARNQIHHHH